MIKSTELQNFAAYSRIFTHQRYISFENVQFLTLELHTAENFIIQFHTDRQPLFKSPRFITKRNSVTPPSFNCYIRVGTVGCTRLYFVARFIGDQKSNPADLSLEFKIWRLKVIRGHLNTMWTNFCPILTTYLPTSRGLSWTFGALPTLCPRGHRKKPLPPLHI